MTRAWKNLFLGIALPVVVAACGGATGDGGEAAARSALRALVVERSVAVLVFDPQDCLTCESQTARWLELRRRAPGSVMLVATREPTPSEARVLTLRRIPLDTIIGDRALARESRGGRVNIFRRGSFQSSGTLSDSTILHHLQRELVR